MYDQQVAANERTEMLGMGRLVIFHRNDQKLWILNDVVEIKESDNHKNER
jgi:hypothetical protein